MTEFLRRYPMIESYKEASAFAFEDFSGLSASQPLKTYKEMVSNRLNDGGLSQYCGLKAYDGKVFARGIAASLAKANSLSFGKDPQRCYGEVLQGSLSEMCDDADLVRPLVVQQQMFEERQEVAVLCTALFFLTAWPLPIDHAWAACKSVRMV